MKKNFVFASLLLSALCATASAETIFGMTTADSGSSMPGLGLVSFDSATPGSLTTIGAFSGVVAGQSVRSIDYNSADGKLYAISTSDFDATGQLYTVNTSTGALTAIGSGLTLTGNNSFRVELEFNSATGLATILTGAVSGNSFIVNPLTGAVTTQNPDLSFASSFSIIGGAYSGSNLYAWDYLSDSLMSVDVATGVLTLVSAPDTFLTGNGGLGMDISAQTNTLYVAHDDPATATISSFYTRDLVTGAQTKIGEFGPGVFVSDIAVAAVPEPATLAILGFAAVVAGRRRAKKA